MAKCIATDYLNKKYFEHVTFEIDKNKNNIEKININTSEIIEEVLGFGGAFTEASGYVFKNANKEIQDKIIKLYFDKKDGIKYNLGRMSINSSDFGLGNYTYLPEGSKDLEDFDLSREEKYTLPMFRQALEFSNDMILTCAPWSPPPFMKTNNKMNQGGKLLSEYYDLYADYLIKYILEMRKKGINVEYLSLQNEPEATQTWDSCIYTPEEMIKLAKVIHPKLLKENLENGLLLQVE